MRRRAVALAAAVAFVAPVLVTAPGADAAPTTGLAWATGLSVWNRTSSPTLADVDGDGDLDVVVGAQDGWVRVHDLRSGATLPGWPQPVVVDPRVTSVPTAIDSSPTVGDLDGDGKVEVVVGAGSNWMSAQPGGVVVFRRDGSVRCRRRTIPWNGLSSVYSTPALGDVDGDGFDDIVFGSFDHYIHAWNRNCGNLSGFPFFNADTVWASPALHDVDRDGRVEIFIGGDSSPSRTTHAGGVYRSLEWTGGPVRQRWVRPIGDTFFSSGAIGDIDGDGRLEVVTGAGDYWGHLDGRKVWAFHLDDGSDVPGWPQSTGGTTLSAPSIGDLDGDGRAREVVLGNTDGNVYAFRGNGTRLWVRRPSEGSRFSFAGPTLADLNGDGAEDVVLGNDFASYVLSGRNGAQLQQLMRLWSFDTSAAVGKVGATWYVVLSGFNTPNRTSRIEVHRLTAPSKSPSWPMWRRNAAHLGGSPPSPFCREASNPKPAPSSASADGYWILGSDGGVFALSAPFHGSLSGRSLSVAAIAATPSGNGYWIPTGDGRVFTFGDAKSYGSMAGRALNKPIRRLIPTPTGKGYWLLGGDGGVFSFGDATFHGSTGAMRLNAPVISMEATPTGKGYWLLALDGGIFSFGDATFHGSTGAMRLAAPVYSMSARPQGDGYWLLGLDGGVFSFGGARFWGSLPGTGRCVTPLGIQLRATATGLGYYLLSVDGKVWTFGDAKGYGSAPPLSGGHSAKDLALHK